MQEKEIYLKNCTAIFDNKKCYVAKQDRVKKGYGGASYTRYLVVFADGSTKFIPSGEFNKKSKPLS